MIILVILMLPFIELYAWYLFIDKYSFLDALLVIFSGGGVGIIIMKTQGKASLLAVQSSLDKKQVPTNILLHRGLIMIGGLFIFIPGLISKILGTFFIMPGGRHLLVMYLKWFFSRKMINGTFQMFSMNNFSNTYSANFESKSRDVIDIQPNHLERTDKK